MTIDGSPGIQGSTWCQNQKLSRKQVQKVKLGNTLKILIRIIVKYMFIWKYTLRYTITRHQTAPLVFRGQKWRQNQNFLIKQAQNVKPGNGLKILIRITVKYMLIWKYTLKYTITRHQTTPFVFRGQKWRQNQNMLIKPEQNVKPREWSNDGLLYMFMYIFI